MKKRQLPLALYAVAIPAALTIIGRLAEHFHVGELLSQIALNWRGFFRTLWSDLFAAFDISLSPLASDMLTFAMLIIGTQIAGAFARFAEAAEEAEPDEQITASSPEQIAAMTARIEEDRRVAFERQRERYRQLPINVLAALLAFAAFFFGALSGGINRVAPPDWQRYVQSSTTMLSIGEIGATLLIVIIFAAMFFLVVGPALFHVGFHPTPTVTQSDDGSVRIHIPTKVPKPPSFNPRISIPAGALGSVCIVAVAALLVQAGGQSERLEVLTIVAAGLMSMALVLSVLLHSNALTRILVMVAALILAGRLIEFLSPFFEYLSSVVERASSSS